LLSGRERGDTLRGFPLMGTLASVAIVAGELTWIGEEVDQLDYWVRWLVVVIDTNCSFFTSKVLLARDWFCLSAFRSRRQFALFLTVM
jgi:hypothetical protein